MGARIVFLWNAMKEEEEKHIHIKKCVLPHSNNIFKKRRRKKHCPDVERKKKTKVKGFVRWYFVCLGDGKRACVWMPLNENVCSYFKKKQQQQQPQWSKKRAHRTNRVVYLLSHTEYKNHMGDTYNFEGAIEDTKKLVFRTWTMSGSIEKQVHHYNPTHLKELETRPFFFYFSFLLKRIRT